MKRTALRLALAAGLVFAGLFPLWSSTPALRAEHFSQPIEETVYVTKTGEKYHRGNCGYLSKSKRAIALSEAKAAGYTPCSRCKPAQ